MRFWNFVSFVGFAMSVGILAATGVVYVMQGETPLVDRLAYTAAVSFVVGMLAY